VSTSPRIAFRIPRLISNRHIMIGMIAVSFPVAGTAAMAAQHTDRRPATSTPTPTPAPSVSPLRALDASIQQLTKQVSLSVVQIFATGYGPVGDRREGHTDVVIGPQHSSGSGVVIDAEGYIITNAHVVAGARRVEVVLPSAADSLAGSLSVAGRTVEAKVVGITSANDLALLKIAAPNLRALAFADYDKIRQGELVFAFGSPEGLRNSVTMGVVSAVARQIDVDSAAIYVQTDAPINPGSSGGPLVNVDGELVGLNTFIYSDSGGSQGLGFAIPSTVVSTAYQQLRKYGHVHRAIIGLNVQVITPIIAAGLGLARSTGLVVSDVEPESPADQAGLRVQDVLTTVDGKPVESPPMLALRLTAHEAGDSVQLGIVRGAEPMLLTAVLVEERGHTDDLISDTDPEASVVHRLGIIGLDITPERAGLLPNLRISSGVLVTARELNTSGLEVSLTTGDVIHAVNGVTVRSLDALRIFLDTADVKTGIVLQIERDGRLMYVSVPAS
jgi:serine protease Do